MKMNEKEKDSLQEARTFFENIFLFEVDVSETSYLTVSDSPGMSSWYGSTIVRECR